MNTNRLYIGQDEVGKVEPFRRIIVVSTYWDGARQDALKSMGAFSDSKNHGLDTKRCLDLGELLTGCTCFSECANGVYENAKLGITYSVYSIDNAKYNELHEGSGKLNANNILAIMHNRAGYNLCTYLSKKGIRITDVVIDNFLSIKDAASKFAKYSASEKYSLDTSGVNMIYAAKAENEYPAVAIASNIANYIEALYADDVRRSIRGGGGDFDTHRFSNDIDDVQYAFDELTRIYGDIDSPNITEHFKHTSYYKNYVRSGKVVKS